MVLRPATERLDKTSEPLAEDRGRVEAARWAQAGDVCEHAAM